MQPNQPQPSNEPQPNELDDIAVPQPAQQQPQPLSQATRIVLQPLSSEDDIRQDAQAAAPASYESAIPDMEAVSTPTTVAHEGDQDSYGPGLITEPLTHQQQSNLNLHSPQPEPSPKKNSKAIVATVVTVLIVAALGIGAYYYFFSGKVIATDLVEVTVQQTTYLRPEEWQAVPLGIGIETYSDLGEGKQAVSTVTIDESMASVRYYGNDRPSDWYETIRPQAISNEKVGSIRLLFRNGSQDCTSDISFNVESDTKTANGTVGMALTTGTCTREDGTYIVKRRTVIGEGDGTYRHITVGASESDWSKNESIYQAILESVGQVTI